MFVRSLMLVPVLAVLSACAFSEDVAEVPYTPLHTAPMAASVPLGLNVVDGRTTNRTRISVKINGYGMDAAPIRASRPVTDIVRDALTVELKNRGFQVATGTRVVDVTVDSFYNNYGVGLVSGNAHGDVKLLAAVTDGAQLRYQQTYEGRSESRILLANGSNAAASVSQALQDAIGRMFADAAFISALTAP